MFTYTTRRRFPTDTVVRMISQVVFLLCKAIKIAFVTILFVSRTTSHTFAASDTKRSIYLYIVQPVMPQR